METAAIIGSTPAKDLHCRFGDVMFLRELEASGQLMQLSSTWLGCVLGVASTIAMRRNNSKGGVGYMGLARLKVSVVLVGVAQEVAMNGTDFSH